MKTNKPKLKRKLYRKPELIAYGSVMELTTGGSGTTQEGKKMKAPKRYP